MQSLVQRNSWLMADRAQAGRIAQSKYFAATDYRRSRPIGLLRGGDRLLSRLPLRARSLYADRFSLRASDQSARKLNRREIVLLECSDRHGSVQKTSVVFHQI